MRSMRQKKLLKLVPYEDPILHQKTIPITFPLEMEDILLIENMRYSILPKQLKKAKAPWDAAVGMAANQWGVGKSIFIYCPDADAANAKIIINPSYTPIGDEKITDKEGCFSVPFAMGTVTRYKHIAVTYQDEQGKIIEENLSDWPAVVWQHENDHLNGYLYDNCELSICSHKVTFNSEEELVTYMQTCN